MPSVFDLMGRWSAYTTIAAAMPPTHAEIQMTGPQPRSIQRTRAPTSSARLPVPHRRHAHQQYATIGP